MIITLHSEVRESANYHFENDGATCWIWPGQQLVAGAHMGLILPSHLSSAMVSAESLAAVNAAALSLGADEILHITHTVERSADDADFLAGWED